VCIAMRGVHEALPAKSHRNARADIVAQCDGAQELRSVGRETFASRERGRHHGAAWMRKRGRVRIIGFIGLGEDTISHGRFDGPAEDIRGYDGADLFASVRSNELNGRVAGREFGAGNHGSDGVEHVMFGFLDHGVGQRAIARVGHVGAEPHHGGTGLVCQCEPWPAGDGGRGDAGLLQQTATADTASLELTLKFRIQLHLDSDLSFNHAAGISRQFRLALLVFYTEIGTLQNENTQDKSQTCLSTASGFCEYTLMPRPDGRFHLQVMPTQRNSASLFATERS